MKRIDSSFRDPDGYMFEYEGELYRTVNPSYQPDYDHLLSSGLYKQLVDRGLIVSFKEVDQSSFGLKGLYKVLKPERILFISYPYEWSFNMLKDAALLTLEIQKIALDYGMSLKDASAFNIQFQNGKPIFIDTLSFELYPVNRPWIAYRQFCQHFLAPLAIMSHVDPRLNRLFVFNIDGIPLNLATKILPFSCCLSLGLFLHIFLHAKAQKKHAERASNLSKHKKIFSSDSMKTLLEGLKVTVENQNWKPIRTEWEDYTFEGVHKQEYTEFKSMVISLFLDIANPHLVWDLGANTGHYSRIAANKGSQVISFDMDIVCVEKNYLMVKERKETKILPLQLDILNSSPPLGWRGNERLSIADRCKPDMIMALAIVHHLAISSNIPLKSIASYFAEHTSNLIIEFVPKEDEKVQLLLLNREDIFQDYTPSNFEIAFLSYFKIEQKIHSNSNDRIFYLMKKNEG
jgi:hypothetical protein